MAFTELMRFKKQSNDLTDEEFYGSFCKSIGRELIVSSLFEHFKNNLDSIKMATQIQSKIMNKRKKVPNEPSSYDCIDKLPSELISKCGSFLDFNDYFHFGYCNRSIYYSLYSSPTINDFTLSEQYYDIVDNVNLTAFKNVESLGVNIETFNELSPANKTTWAKNKSLQELCIYSYMDMDDMSPDMEPMYMECVDLINNENVKDLTLSGEFSSNLMIIQKMLSRFDHIERLTLREYEIPVDNDNEKNEPCANPFLNLTQLKHFYHDLQRTGDDSVERKIPSLIVNTLCDQLESLSFDGALCTAKKALKFSKLYKLDALWCYEHSSPYDNVDSLKEIGFYCWNEEGNFPDIKSTVINAMFRVISNQKSLETLVLKVSLDHVYDNLTSSGVLKQIEEALLKYAVGRGMNQNLSIKLDLSYVGWRGPKIKADTSKEFGLCVFHVINALSTFKPTGWKFQIAHSLYCMENIEIEQFQLNVLDTLKAKYFVQYNKIEHICRDRSVLDIIIESQ